MIFFLSEKIQQATKIQSSKAQAGLDFVPLTASSVTFSPGVSIASINVTILPDNIPELVEDFKASDFLNINFLD